MHISTDAGKLNQRVAFQHKPVSLTDEIGYQPDGWEDFYSCWAAFSTASGSESWRQGERVAENIVTFTMRVCKLLKTINTTEYRIVFGGRYYDILAIDDVQSAGSLLTIRASEKKQLVFVDGIVSVYRKESGNVLNLIQSYRFNYEKIANAGLDDYAVTQRCLESNLTVRIPLDRSLTALNVAEVDGAQYEITLVEHDKETLPPSTVLSLKRVEVEKETVVLVAAELIRDEIGQLIEGEETPTEILCTVKSITRSEWSVAQQHDYQAEWMLEVFHEDYRGERTVIFRGQRYRIYRTFCKGEQMELYLGLRVGEMNGNSVL